MGSFLPCCCTHDDLTNKWEFTSSNDLETDRLGLLSYNIVSWRKLRKRESKIRLRFWIHFLSRPRRGLRQPDLYPPKKENVPFSSLRLLLHNRGHMYLSSLIAVAMHYYYIISLSYNEILSNMCLIWKYYIMAFLGYTIV